MTAETALGVAAYVLIADAVIALSLGGLLGELGAGLLGATLALAWWRRRRRAWGVTPPVVDRVLAAALVVAAVVDLAWLAASLLDGFVHLLLALMLLRLFTARTPRDVRNAGLLSFFALVASSAVTFGVGFLFVFLVYLVAGTGLLMLDHAVTESARAVSPGGARPRVERGLLGLVACAAAGTLALTAALFFVVPRVGEATLALRTEARRLVAGFSDHVELGAVGEIEADAAVAMRVRVTGAAMAPDRLPNLRWRGIVLDHFDGHAWRARERERLSLRPWWGGHVQLASVRGPLVTQEVFLEPIGTDVVFGAPRVVRLRVRGGAVIVDDTGTLSVPSAAARLQYTVESELEPPLGERPANRGARGPLDAATTARYLELPPLAPRIPALAREVTRASAGPDEAAVALTGFLSREFRYTLRLEKTTSLPPVEEFLFVRRSGNCEYFATALAVLLRTIGIPARVVNGFQRGEWNPYGGYFVVRMRDAHSWVEAYLPDAGWVSLDPSPRPDAAGLARTGGVNLYLDALRMRWYRYVVSWSLRDQVQMTVAVRQAAGSWRPWRLRAPAVVAPLPGLFVALGAAALVVLGRLAWRRRSGRAAHVSPAVPAFYRRALARLARHGLSPRGGETAREFSARVTVAAPASAEPFGTLTAAYERVRFGGSALGRDELCGLAAAASTLRRALSRGPSPPPSPR